MKYPYMKYLYKIRVYSLRFEADPILVQVLMAESFEDAKKWVEADKAWRGNTYAYDIIRV